jgi:hypothetical protein
MRIYTVHQPPEKWREERRGPERFAFVRDGFHFWAFLLTPLWMIRRRLWLVLIGYVLLWVAISAALYFLNARSAMFAVYLLLGFLVGLEASSLRRWTLRRRGWREVGVVVAKDQEEAERRFFDTWDGDAGLASAAPPPSAAPFGTLRRPPPSSQAIGLFPEPGATR